MTKPYFHEQPYEIAARIPGKAAMRWYQQPNWCKYPEEALNGLNGCWSLVFGKVKDEESCTNCNCNINSDNYGDF
jgi:hypothetical protein